MKDEEGISYTQNSEKKKQKKNSFMWSKNLKSVQEVVNQNLFHPQVQDSNDEKLTKSGPELLKISCESTKKIYIYSIGKKNLSIKRRRPHQNKW